MLQVIPISLHLNSSKWLLVSLYRPEHMKVPHFLEHLDNLILTNSKSISNIIVIGDFNMKEDDPYLAQFRKCHNLYNLIKDPTCFKSLTNPSAIDHIFTNQKHSFTNSCTIETGLSDHHKMIFTCMKSTYSKIPPKVITYRDYKNFDENAFLSEVCTNLDRIPIVNYTMMNQVSESVLEKHAPTKTKTVRGNDKIHMNKTLRKAIMHRSKLKNIADKTADPQDILRYKKQRNVCVYLNKKAKQEAMKNINVKRIENARSFWNTYKPYLSKKYTTDEKIILVEEDKIVSDDDNIAHIFNEYFTNITKSIHAHKRPSEEGGTSTVAAAVTKHSFHPSILKIKENITNKSFNFIHVLPEDVQKQINKLKTSKKSRGIIPIKIIKMLAKVNIFS